MRSVSLRKIALIVSCGLLFSLFGLIPAHAQFSPVSVNSTPFNAASGLCDGATHTANVQNLGQTVHFITFSTTGNPVTFRVNLAFSDSTGSLSISDVGTDPAGGVLSANGYYTIVQVQVVCTGGTSPTVTVNYYGSSSGSVPLTGRQDITSYKRVIDTADTANASHTYSGIQTPYGNSCGQILFTYSATGVSGSTIAVNGVEGSQTFTVLPAQTLLNSASAQIINVPCFPASTVQVVYTSGGGASQTYTVNYVFNRPGVQQPGGLSTPGSGTSSARPLQVISDALSQGFAAATGAVTNPAAGTFYLAVANTAGSTKSLYFDRAVLAATAGIQVIVQPFTACGGSTCVTAAGNLKLGSSVTSAAGTTTTPGASLTGQGNLAISTYVPGGTVTLDLTGIICPPGTTCGVAIEAGTALTGTLWGEITWYEKQ